MDVSETLAHLKAKGNLSEVAQVTTFKGYRTNKQGETKAVTIEVYDSGLGDLSRYLVQATDEDGRMAIGNAQTHIETAINQLHWWDLDGDLLP